MTKCPREAAAYTRPMGLTARTLGALLVLAGAAFTGCGGDNPSQAAPPSRAATLVVTLPEQDSLAFVDPAAGVVGRVAVGASPWGVAVHAGRAYVSTARHVAIVDLRRRSVLARVAYRTRVGAAEVGEYRAGGMGIAVGRGGGRVYVGVHREGGGPGRVEVLDPRRRRIVATAPIGERPFDVLAGRDGRRVYTVDHDSYGVTQIDTRTMATRTFRVAPLGGGAFDKLNYGAVGGDGRLLFPINGEVLAVLDPRTGAVRTRRMRSRVHQAGVALSRGRLLTVGAESLGSGSPNLSVFDLASGRERLIPLRRPHEDVAVGSGGREAYLSGGYTRGGWPGITVVALDSGRTRELPLDSPPLGIAAIPVARSR